MCDLPNLEALAETDATSSQADGTDAEERKSQRDKLVELANVATFWHDPDGEPFGTIEVNGHAENWSVKSRDFRTWLQRRYYENYHGAPSSQALQDAIGSIEARARFGGEEHQVYLRVAELDGAIYLDLADGRWRVVRITPDGWDVIDPSPVKFRRTRGMRPISEPQRGGSVNDLRRFLNVASNGDFRLIVGWLLAALRPSGPYPIMVFNGEQGTGKSTQARVLRMLVDPNAAAIRTPPREERDLLIAARNGWVVCLDNLSGVSPWLSDGLCRLATGGGFSARQLYTDMDEVLFEVSRPAILNCIPDLATRPDLSDRSIMLTLPMIGDDQRLREAEFWRDFEATRATIMGALLDVVSAALRRLPDVNLDRAPRMADFAYWITAAEPALGWPPGSFLEAYEANRETAVEATIEGDAVAQAVCDLMEDRAIWRGTASQLMTPLEAGVSEFVLRSNNWPKSPNSLSGRLRRAAPSLRAVGIEVELGIREGRQRTRLIEIRKTA